MEEKAALPPSHIPLIFTPFYGILNFTILGRTLQTAKPAFTGKLYYRGRLLLG